MEPWPSLDWDANGVQLHIKSIYSTDSGCFERCEYQNRAKSASDSKLYTTIYLHEPKCKAEKETWLAKVE